MFLKGFPVAIVTFYFTKTTESAIIGVWFGTKTLLLNDKVASFLLIIRSFESVETGLSHLKTGII